MEDSLIKMAAGWALARLNDRTTWAAWLAVLAAKLGVTVSPQFDTLIINVALSLVAVAGYAIKGQPIFTKEVKK